MAFIWYMLGLLTIPVAIGSWAFFGWAFGKTSGTGGCILDWCNRKEYELGDHFNLTVWLARMRHQYLVGPRHRREVLAYWQSQKDRGMPVHPRAIRKLK